MKYALPPYAILLSFLTLALLTGNAQAANCTASYTYTDNGSSSNYSLNTGDSLKITGGIFTGYIDSLASGSSICVESGATFSPGGFNNISGALTNYGTTTLQNYVYGTGTVIDNYGTMTFNGLNTNGAITFTNRAAATMNFPYSFQLGMNSTMTNNGLIVAGQDFNTEHGTTLTNNYRMEVEGNFNPDGVVDNYGRVYAKAFMNINMNSEVSNYCTLVSYDGFNNNSPLMNNQGTILITSATGTPGGLWQNNQPFQNGSSAKIAGGDFFNNAAFSGGGFMIFSGDTRNQAAFNGNSAADRITFYDETQTGSQIFDTEGTVPTNTVRAVFTRPTELDAPTTCTVDYKNFANPTSTEISGTVYSDDNGNGNYDSGSEAGITSITVTLKNDADNTVIASSSTAIDGSYSFIILDDTLTYRLEVDTADSDLPNGYHLSSANPLSGVTVTAGNTTTNQNFGFVPSAPLACADGSVPIMLDWSAVSWTDGDTSTTYSNIGGSGHDITVNWRTVDATFRAGRPHITNDAIECPSSTGSYCAASTADVSSLTAEHAVEVVFSPDVYGVDITIGDLQDKRDGGASANEIIEGVSLTGGSTTGLTVTPGANVTTGLVRTDYAPTTSDVGDDNSVRYTWNNTTSVSNLEFTLRNDNAGPGIYGNALSFNMSGIVFCPQATLGVGSISGVVYTDANSNNNFDSGTESGIGSITVNLLNDADGSSVASTSTVANGTYQFSGLDPALTYRIEVDTTDTDLPTGFIIGTANPLTGVTVTSGNTTTNQNFGFDQSCSLVVTTTADTDNATDNSGSLRDAIECANSETGADIITFNMPTTEAGYDAGAGVWTITPTSALPALTDAGTTIDASTQTGASCGDLWAGSRNLTVQLDGNSSINTGLLVDTSGFTLNGMAITNFTQYGLRTTTNADNAVFTCNHIGVAADGMTAGSNNTGMELSGYNAQVGGVKVGEGNIIAGNSVGGGIVFSSTNGAAGNVYNNFIGMGLDGASTIGNGIGIWNAGSTGLQIGGSSSGQRNLISGNTNAGVTFVGPNTNNNFVQGNYIGTSKNGLAAAGNGAGINFGDFSTDITVGGSGVGEGNLIAGNTSAGIASGADVGEDAHNNAITGNIIGLGTDGVTSLPNQDGIALYEVNNFTVTGNTIAGNSRWGIMLQNGADNVLLSRNSIFNNASMGIELQSHDGSFATSVGVTLNDANDADDGANGLVNFPIIHTLDESGGNLTITGCAPAGATVELFEADVSAGGAATPGDNHFGLSTDYGEGQTYLGSFVEGDANDTNGALCTLPADADGNDQSGMLAFDVSIPMPAALSAGDILTATATVAGTGTSEFSPAHTYRIACKMLVTTTDDSDSVYDNSGSLRDAIECANSTPGTDTISFSIPDTESGFLDPDGAASSGDEYWRITLNSQLPAITEALSIDGSTQATNRGNTNSGSVAAATTVGTGNVALAAVAAPEVEIVGQAGLASGFDIKAANVGIYGLGIRRFDTAIRISQAGSSGILLNGLALGVNAVSGNDPGAGERSGQHLAVDAADSSIVLANSVLGYNDGLRGIVTGQNGALGAVSLTVSGNHFVGNGQSGNTDNGAIEILRTQNPSILIAGNRFSGRGAASASDFAIEFNAMGGADIDCSGCLISNNDIHGYHDGIGYQGNATLSGLEIGNNRIHDHAANAIALGNVQDTVVSQNHLYNNGGNATVISGNNAKGNIITQNRIYNNGALGIDLAGGNETSGITLNDANDTDTGPNDLLNFPPMLQVVKSSTGNIILRGCAMPGSVIEFFEADVSPGGSATPGDNRFGLSQDYGEGETYLGSLAEGGAADMDAGSCSLPGKDGNTHTGMNAFQFSIAAPAGIDVGDYLTATATLAASGTSEFSPTTRIDDSPPIIGGGDCTATGGSDILFIVDNSGSITPAEYSDFSQTIQKVGAQLLTDNPANRIAVGHFGGPSDSLVSGGQYVYFERDFSSTPMTAPVRQFGHAGAYNSAWIADHLAGALQQFRYGLDGDSNTSSSYILSSLKETSRNLAAPLQIVLMTDAVRYGDWVPTDISMLIDPVGSGAEPNDGSDFTVYNQLKTEGVFFSVVSFNPDPTDIAASAAIASSGGSYTGTVDPNPSDPEGSQTTPRRYVAVTAGFQLTTDQIIEVSDGAAICSSAISGTIFEDVNYGGGNGRPFSTPGAVGVANASIEVYDSSGAYVASTISNASGSYRMPNLPPNEDYYVRVVSNTVNSSRSGSNGSEIPVMTYRSNGATETTDQVGGHNPAALAAGVNSGIAILNTTTFTFSSGTLAGKQAHAVQRVSLTDTGVNNADFGFNFNTIVNANDAGYGSLRQFLLNANLLGDDTTLAQEGLPAGKENAVMMLSTSDPNYDSANNYWSIALQSALPPIDSPLILDSSLQAEFVDDPVIELNGQGAGLTSDGLVLDTGSDGSIIRKLAINRFRGNGIKMANSSHHVIQGNKVGTDPTGMTQLANDGAGILLENTSGNLIGGTGADDGNRIANNSGDGIAVTGATSQSNSLLGNGIYANGGLGIDLGNDGVTANDVQDTDAGPNALLNYPLAEENAFAANGTRIIAYDIDLDAPSGDYRMELFASTAQDPSGNGEGEIFIGYKDVSHPGGGSLNFKGTLNASQAVPSGTFISATLTRKTGADSFAETSEFSDIKDSIPNVVCDDLVSGSGGDMVIDENSPVITLLEATDSNGDPITYVISGGTDSNMFTVRTPAPGATVNCTAIEFITTVIIKSHDADAGTRAVPPGFLPDPGDFEIPRDADGNNVYELQVTATYADGQQYTRGFSVRVADVNEAPKILSTTSIAFTEDTSGNVTDIIATDQDEGSVEDQGISYSISGGADASLFAIDTGNGVLTFRTAPDYDAPMDADRNNVYELEVTATDSGGLTDTKSFLVTIVNNTTDDGVLLNSRVFLQGPYDTADGMMSAELNTLGLLPVSQPYANFGHEGLETLGSLLLEAVDGNAVVDWVLVELRSDMDAVIASRALMLQRDGDLVDAQTGSADLHFAGVTPGDYYVSIRHRNHLDIISANPVTLGANSIMLDFTQSKTATAGEATRFTSGELAMLWAGDINHGQTITAHGPGNDITNMLGSIITSPENPAALTNYILHGYLDADLNMDGKALFAGPYNDANVLVGNVILHPLNSSFAANYIVRGTLQ